MSMTKTTWGKTADSAQVDLYTLMNKNGVKVALCNYGAMIVSFIGPDRAGNMADVTLGFDHFEGYLGNNPYFGCVAGRYANRIAKASFVLNGKRYTLAANNGEHHLHGGRAGFNRKLWEASATENGVAFRYSSVDGEEGYPGTLRCSVTYALTHENALALHYEATTDADTVLNLTNHVYFNLDGAPNILDHELMLNADRFAVTDSGSIPTGELRSVTGTAMDFRSFTRIGERMGVDYEPLKFGQGYDHNWCIQGSALRLAAVARSSLSGRTLTCYTDQPGVQFYSGNFIGRNGDIKGRNGAIYRDHSGFCLETQHYPDSPNQPTFPSTGLRPGETFRSTTIYQLGR